MSTLAKAMEIACTEFSDVYDRGGRPYAEHCMVVAEGVRHLGDDAMIVGWLHDLLEDSHKTKSVWTVERLREEGFSEKVIHSITLLTHESYISYETYISELANDSIAREVKKSDLRHNSQVSRLKGLREKDFARLEKYSRAYHTLNKSGS